MMPTVAYLGFAITLVFNQLLLIADYHLIHVVQLKQMNHNKVNTHMDTHGLAHMKFRKLTGMKQALISISAIPLNMKYDGIF